MCNVCHKALLHGNGSTKHVLGFHVQVSGLDVEQDADEAPSQQQHKLLLSSCCAPEAHSEADPPGDGPEPDDQQSRAALERLGGHMAPASNPGQGALATSASAHAAQVNKSDSAMSGNMPRQLEGQQPKAARAHDKQPAGKQPEALPPHSMVTARDSLPPTEAGSPHQATGAVTAVATAVLTPPGDQSVLKQNALTTSRSVLCVVPGQQVQERSLSMQAALNSPLQDASVAAQLLADDTGNASLAGLSLHEVPASQAVHDTSATVLAKEAVLPAESQCQNLRQLGSDAPTADDTQVTDDAPTVHDTPMVDDAPWGYDPPVADETPFCGPAAGSSKAAAEYTEAPHEDVVTPSVLKPLHQQEPCIQQQQQQSGNTSIEKHSGSSQLGLQVEAAPSPMCNSKLPAEASEGTAAAVLTRMSENPDDSLIVPDSEEPDCAVDEAAAGNSAATVEPIAQGDLLQALA